MLYREKWLLTPFFLIWWSDSVLNKKGEIYLSSATGVDTGGSMRAASAVRFIRRDVAGQTVPSQRTATIEMPTEINTGIG